MPRKTLGELDYAGDDRVVPFRVETLDVRGRAVQMGPALNRILGRHDYPDPVSRLLGEIIVFTVLLGTSLKFDGRLIVQTQSDGPAGLIVADYASPDRIRAYARFDERQIANSEKDGDVSTARLLGKGVLALTIDQGSHTQRYQGVVQLNETSLEEAAGTYFRQSEQIPTEIKLSVAKLVRAGADGTVEQWRAGGLISQFFPDSREHIRQIDLPGGNDEIDRLNEQAHDDAWREFVALVETIEPSELLDPTVGSERLLYRLFQERGVRVFEGVTVSDQCFCSRDRIAEIISGFTSEEIDDCIGDERILVNCEFCSTGYSFDPSDFR